MAQSNVGGVFGFLRKSVGSIVYSTSTASLSGQKKQVARSKPTSVRNPRTIAQIVQRMKVGPAQLFYAAFEKAAGSVEDNPLSHSFQGIPYGPKSRTKFLQLAMTGDPKAYVPKGINFPVPGVYQVSQGSLPSIPWRGISNGEGTSLLPALENGAQMTSNHVEALTGYGVQAGDQITVMALMENGLGQYDAIIGRIIVGANNAWELNDDIPDVGVNVSGLVIDNDSLAAISFIVSRGTTSATAKRSTETMFITPNFQSLMSPEAYDAAVNSYIENVAYNSLNSDWYLNQGSTQAFNGQVYAQQLTLASGTGVDEFTGTFLLGRQVQGAGMRNVIFTSDGTSAGTAYALIDGQWTTAAAYTAARVAAAMGNVTPAYRQYSAAIAAQLSGNA